MLSLLLKSFKKIVTILIMAFLITASFTFSYSDQKEEFIRYSIDDNYIRYQVIEEVGHFNNVHQADIVIRAGEYQGKSGKRIYVNNTTVHLPDDIPIRNDHDGKGFYVSEWDINVKEAKALVNKLRAKGINAKLQIAYERSEDLNAAAKIANKSNPYIYLSLHHNYYDSNSSGYFAMYNPGDNRSEQLAEILSNAIKNNQVPQKCNRPNTGYIGELNSINKSTTPVLLELGFFSNLSELEKICSDSYVDFISTQLANELTTIINTQYK